jgi:hypothetical protein
VAIEMNARRLILLKSIDVPREVSWSVAAANGWVDRYFPTIAGDVKCPIDIINLRAAVKLISREMLRKKAILKPLPSHRAIPSRQ